MSGGFPGPGAGNEEVVFKWRYAVLGWLVWEAGKRMLGQKVSTAAHR